MIDPDLIRPAVMVQCGILIACTLALVVGHRPGLLLSQRILGYGVLYVLVVLCVGVLINALAAVPPTPGVKAAAAAMVPLTVAAVIAVCLDIRAARRDR